MSYLRRRLGDTNGLLFYLVQHSYPFTKGRFRDDIRLLPYVHVLLYCGCVTTLLSLIPGCLGAWPRQAMLLSGRSRRGHVTTLSLLWWTLVALEGWSLKRVNCNTNFVGAKPCHDMCSLARLFDLAAPS